jgi:hypothetical protein
MEQGTQKSAANAEESAAAAEELTAQSNILRDVAEQLGTMVGGSENTRIDVRSTRRAPGARTGYGVASKLFRENSSSLTVKRGTGGSRTVSEREPVLTSEKRFPLEETQFAEF